MLADPRFHGRRHSKRAVNPAEVVVHVVQRNRRFMVSELLRVAICQPGESPNRHAHSEVAALHKRCADVLRIELDQCRPVLVFP